MDSLDHLNSYKNTNNSNVNVLPLKKYRQTKAQLKQKIFLGLFIKLSVFSQNKLDRFSLSFFVLAWGLRLRIYSRQFVYLFCSETKHFSLVWTNFAEKHSSLFCLERRKVECRKSLNQIVADEVLRNDVNEEMMTMSTASFQNNWLRRQKKVLKKNSWYQDHF